MRIASETIQHPANPPSDWGVVLRQRKAKDYLLTAVVVGAALLFVLIFSWNPAWFGANLDNYEWLFYIFAAVWLFFLVTDTLHDPGNRKQQATQEAEDRFQDWYYQVLCPFLEVKYGVKFSTGPIRSYYKRKAYKDGQFITVRIKGVVFERNNFGGDVRLSYFHSVSMEEEIWLEEIIKPNTVKHRAMEPA